MKTAELIADAIRRNPSLRMSANDLLVTHQERVRDARMRILSEPVPPDDDSPIPSALERLKAMCR